MHPLLALALVAVAGLATTRLPSLAMHRPSHGDLLLASGLPLLLAGVLLGPGIGVLDRTVLRDLAPATALAIGWLGAAFGAQLEWRVIRRIPPALWGFGAAQAAVTFALVALTAANLLRLRPALGAAWAPAVPGVLTLGAAAVASAPAAGLRRRVVHIVGLGAVLDTLLGVLAFTLMLARYHPRVPVAGAPLGWVRWLALAGGSGVLVGMLFLSLSRLRAHRQDLALALPGVVLLGAGVGYAADLSPFLVCALAAVLIVNLSPHRRRVQELLHGWERPIYAIFLIILGALLALPTAWILLAVPVLAVVRIAAKWGASHVGLRWLPGSRWPTSIGLATVAQGSVALALARNFPLNYRGGGPESVVGAGGVGVLTTITLAVVVAQLAAPWLSPRARAHPVDTVPPIAGG